MIKEWAFNSRDVEGAGAGAEDPGASDFGAGLAEEG